MYEKMVPVKTREDIPKGKVLECVRALKDVEVKSITFRFLRNRRRLLSWTCYHYFMTICFGFMLPYAGRISASEKEEDRTVCLALSEHGRMRFADSKEEANEETRVYQEGDTVTLAIEP